jgi:hypothetical protein
MFRKNLSQEVLKEMSEEKSILIVGSNKRLVSRTTVASTMGWNT